MLSTFLLRPGSADGSGRPTGAAKLFRNVVTDGKGNELQAMFARRRSSMGSATEEDAEDARGGAGEKKLTPWEQERQRLKEAFRTREQRTTVAAVSWGVWGLCA